LHFTTWFSLVHTLLPIHDKWPWPKSESSLINDLCWDPHVMIPFSQLRCMRPSNTIHVW
jgi:hypothetical protein